MGKLYHSSAQKIAQSPLFALNKITVCPDPFGSPSNSFAISSPSNSLPLVHRRISFAKKLRQKFFVVFSFGFNSLPLQSVSYPNQPICGLLRSLFAKSGGFLCLTGEKVPDEFDDEFVY